MRSWPSSGSTAASARSLVRPAPSISISILLGDMLEDSPGLQVPHPRFRERFFVLGPLAEVAPELVDPVTGLRVWELLRNLLRDEGR